MYVVESTRGKAKSLFHAYARFYCDGWYTDVRSMKVCKADNLEPSVYDEDCPELEALGARYYTEEEVEALGLI